ncbi:MAG: hypothetical protein H8E44_28610, partial [Planctomycetes bacterium]|nr:hypothetical protein [Planctomycetota bacterium]
MRLLTVLSFAVLVFVAIVLLVVVIVAWPPNMGLDFTGGVQLVYEVDRNALVTDDEAGGSPAVVDWPSLIRALTNRVNPAGMKEVVVRRYGEWQVEIVVPQADRRELAMIKKLISTAGTLEFRIVAKPNHAPHEYVINLAKQQAQDRNKRRAKNVRDGDDTIVGYWARVDREEGEDGKLGALRVQVAGDVIRNATTGELTAWNQIELDSVEIDVLMIVDEDPRFHVKGEHLGMVSRGYDETMRPCVRFNMRGQGAGLMGALTGSNL